MANKTKPRQVPINFQTIAEETSLRRGKLGRSPIFGWGVQNVHGEAGANFCCIDPPQMSDGETRLWIECGHWCFA